MKSAQMVKAVIAATACACALVVAVGCSAASSSAAGSASASAAGSANASSAASESANASSAAASAASGSSADAVSGSAAATDAAASSSSAATASSSTTASASASSQKASGDAATAQGSQTFEGTVHVTSAEELVKLQGSDIDPAMASNGGEYAVVVFDQPTEVTGMSADGSGARTQSSAMIGVAEYTKYDSFVVEYGDLESWRSLDGQHVTISVQAEDIMFPTDVRLPIGEPSANTVTIL